MSVQKEEKLTKAQILARARDAKAKKKIQDKESNGPNKTVLKSIEKAEENKEFTRVFQQQYDNYENMVVYKKNKLECEVCGYDREPRGIIIWQDPKTKKTYMNFRTVCWAGCNMRDRVYEVNEVKLEEHEIFLFDY